MLKKNYWRLLFFLTTLCLLAGTTNYRNSLQISPSGEYYRLLVNRGNADMEGAGNYTSNSPRGFTFRVGTSLNLLKEWRLNRHQSITSFVLDSYPPIIDRFISIDLGKQSNTLHSVYFHDVKMVNSVLEVHVSVGRAPHSAANASMSRPAIRASVLAFFKPVCIRAWYQVGSAETIANGQGISGSSASDIGYQAKTIRSPVEALDGSYCAKEIVGFLD